LALHDLLQLQRDLVAAERLLIEARLAAATTSWPLEIDALLAAMQP
jgi:hypothetical protein